MEYIFACSCSGVKERSVKAFQIVKPDKEMPEILVGKDRMRKVAERYPSGSNAAKHLNALAKRNNKFSYYVVIDNETHDILELYDLLTGKRLA